MGVAKNKLHDKRVVTFSFLCNKITEAHVEYIYPSSYDIPVGCCLHVSHLTRPTAKLKSYLQKLWTP